MQTRKTLNFQRERRIGEILQDTFAFLRQEFKPLVGSILRITGIYLILLVAVTGVLIYQAGGVFKGLVDGIEDMAYQLVFLTSLGVFFLLLVVVTVLMYGTILHYVRLYQVEKKTPAFEEIKPAAYGSFWPIVGLWFMLFFLLIGLMLAIVPLMAYLSVEINSIFAFFMIIAVFLSAMMWNVLANVAYPVMIIRGIPVSRVIGVSLGLLKGNWLRGFGLFLLLSIMISIGSMITYIPTMIYQMFKLMSSSAVSDAQFNPFEDPIYIALTLLPYGVQAILGVMIPIGAGILYFDLDEQKRGTGTRNQIESLGQDPHNR